MVPLDTFVADRLADDLPVGDARSRAEAVAKRQVLEAFRRARYGTMHQVGIGVALKAIAGIWADHADFDPTWSS